MVRWLKAAWNICALFQGKAHAVVLALPAILILLSPIAARAADGDGCNYFRNNSTLYDNANYNVSSSGPTTIINQAPFGPQTGITNFAAGTEVYYEYTVSSSAVNARLNRAPLAGVATVFVDTNASGSGSITLPVSTRSMAASAYVPGAGSGTVTWTIYCGVRATQAIASTTGTMGTAMSFTPVTATFGRGTHSYALSGGTLPAGLAFNTGTGAITGTPTAALAATTFTVTVTHQGTGSASQTFQLAVNEAAPVAGSFTASVVPYNTGSASAATISVTGNVTNSPTNYAVGSATTAQGGSVSIDASGQASYTPPVGFRGNDSFTYTASNGGGTSGPATVTVPVNNPILATSLTGSGTQLSPLSGVQINTSGGRALYTCSSAVTGAPPAGVTINPDCSITGTPTASGTFNFTVNVTDSSTGTGPFTQSSSTLALAIAAIPVPTLTSLSASAANAVGSTTGGGSASTLTLTGADFTNANAVGFGGAAFGAGSFTIDNDSTITLTVPSAAAAGVSGAGGAVNVTVSSATGASSARTFIYVLMPTVDAITTPTNDNTPTITGTATPGATINLTLAGPSPFSTSGITADGSGDWTFTPTQRSDGSYTVQVTQTVSTVTSGNSNQVAFDIDTTPPAAPTVVSPTEGQSTGGSVILSGVTEADSTVEIQIDAFPFVSASVVGTGWTFSATGLVVGPHTATVRAKDSLGNPSTDTVRTFTVVAAPTSGALAPAGGPTAGGTTVTLTGTNLTGATLTVDGATVSTSNNTGTSLTFVTPAHAAGAVAVVVTTAGGPASTTYTYIAPVQLSPAAGALPGGTATASYSQTFTASGGTAPYTFSTTGTPPPGLTLAADGTLSGTVTSGGTFNFDVNVSDSSSAIAGSAFTVSQSYSITIIRAGQTITFPALSDASLSVSPLTLSGGSAATASSGLAVSYSSATTSVCGVSGTSVTLLTIGTCTINADQAGDASYDAAARVQQSFTVTPAHLVLSTGGVSGNQVGVSYSQSNTASGGIAPYTYALDAGAFVPGTSLDPNTGLVSGTPTIAGTFSYRVGVTDSQGTPVTAIGSITTTTVTKGDQTASFTSTAPSGATVGGSAYTVTATATSGLAVVFSLDGASTGCAVLGNSVTFTSTGTCQINANQPGDTNWNAAAQIQQSFTVGPAAAISASVTFAPAAMSAGDTGVMTITFTNTNASDSPAFNALLTSPTLTERGAGAPGGTCSLGSASNPTATTVQFGNIVVAPGNCTITLDYTAAAAGSTSGFTLGAFTPGGYPTTSATAGNTFTVVPTVTGVSPPSGPVSQVVTVSGTGFSTTPGDNIVMFGAVAGSVTAASATSLTVTAPATGSGAATVTVTVNGQTSTGSATYTFIDKPVAADKPGVVVAFNSPGTAIDLSGSISGGPHNSIAIGTAPAHGTTSIAGDVVTYTPTTGYSGPDSFTYTATGAGGTSDPGTVSIQVTIAVPTSEPLSINALAGRTVTVDLTGGADGGPFTDGAIVSVTPADAADVELIEGGTAMNRTYSLQFTSRTNTEQAVTVLYTLSNAGGTSAPLTLTVQVGARSDPSDDPEVLGLEAAETGAARRTAETQIRNFGRRMEQLHDGRCTQGMGARLSLGIPMSDNTAPEQQVDDDPTQPERIGADNGTASDSTPAMAGADSQNPTVNCDLRDPGHIALWTDGTVTIGSRDATSGADRFDFTTSGLTAGADIVLAPGVTIGIGVGVGRDQTDVGDNGSEVEASSWAVGAYGSFRPVEDAFIDVLAGVGGIDFDLTRYVTDTGGSASAERNADLLFGSVRAGIDRNDGPLRWSLFGGIEASRTNFDSYVEDGPESYALAYDEREMDSISGLLGGRFEYSFLSGHTVVTPRGRFEYRYDFEQAEGQRVRFSDWLTGPSYLIDADGWSRSEVTVEVGIGAALPMGWQMGADVTGDLSGNSRSMGLRLEISRGF